MEGKKEQPFAEARLSTSATRSVSDDGTLYVSIIVTE